MRPARRHGPRARRSAGLTLVELLVSLVIGMALMIAVVSGYVGSAGASRMAEAQGRMNEDAQAALAILTQQLRAAGDNPKRPNYAPGTPRNPLPAGHWPIRGCDGNFSNVSFAPNIGALTCVAGSTDSVAVSYEADTSNTVRSSGNKATDCLGQELPLTSVPTGTSATVSIWNTATSTVTPAAVSFNVADNRFYIANANNVPSLYCKGNGNTVGQPLVENVEDLQLRFGVAAAASTPPLVVTGYLSQAGMDANADLAALTADARWTKVATVRICIVVRSEGLVAPDADSARYVGCDGTEVTAPPDLRLRRAYSTTVVLRNRVAPS